MGFVLNSLSVWRRNPGSAVALVALTAVLSVQATRFILRERIELLEQQIAAGGGTRTVFPLPSPISLGDSRNTYRRGRGRGQWSPTPGYIDATIDWGSVPVNMEILAEIFVSARFRGEDSAEGLSGYARLRDVTMTETIATFDPVDVRDDLESRRFTSRPLPRGVSVQTYRLEVSADPRVRVNARGRLLYRRR